MTGRPEGEDDLTVTPSALGLPLPAAVVDGGRVVASNAALRALVGEALLDVPFTEWFPPAARAAVEAALRDPGRYPPVVRLGETEIWVALHPAGASDSGAQVVVLRDATDEQFGRAALDVTADSTFVLGGDGSNRWRSAQLRERSGVSDEEAAETSASERLHPEDMPFVFEAFASVTPDHPLTVVARSRAVDADDRWETIEMVVWDRLAHDVLAGYLVQVHNLDEGRTVETALGQADPGLLSLTEAAPVGIAVTDPSGSIVYRNPAARELLGPDLQSLGRRDWLELARPEDRAGLAEAVRGALEDGVERTVTACFDTTRADTPVVWLRLRVAPQRSASGQAGGIIATIEDVTEQVQARADLKEAEARMRHLATHDSLTSLPNRAMLTDELERASARHDRAGAGLAVLFCDLDGFKPVNDRFGHAAGDVVLVEVAERLRSTVRTGDLVARLGGDEFVVLCEATGDDTTALDELAQRLHHHIEQEIEVAGGTVSVGVSIGIGVVAPGQSCPADRLLLLADEAMYAAKAAGRGRTVLQQIA
jgi:diguanylate cyclase (GGDEF)-like protein/PAS domain S-box-containing protein